MFTFIKNIFTARDNETFSLTKLFGIGAVCSMLYNFIHVSSVDFQGLGIAVAGMIAALAVKYHVEDK